jgi:hypothetical protein
MQTIRLNLERLEDRVVPAIGPSTPWHYAPAANFAAGSYNAPGDPGSDGFNLVNVFTPDQMALVPDGDKALVYVPYQIGEPNGSAAYFASFVQFATKFVGNPKVFGFYISDEPNLRNIPATALKEEADWLHANDPGVKAFFVLGGSFGTNFAEYTPKATDMDLVGLDPYPITIGGATYSLIPNAVNAAEAVGWSQAQIVPIYQVFGNSSGYALPTVEQEQEILAIWGNLIPHPAFDYAYSWGGWEPDSLVNSPDLQAVFMAHNSNQPPASPVASNSGSTPPASLVALLAYGLERLEVDVFTRLATVQSSFALEAQQANAALQANPWNGTALGSMVAAQVDQLLGSGEAAL